MTISLLVRGLSPFLLRLIGVLHLPEAPLGVLGSGLGRAVFFDSGFKKTNTIIRFVLAGLGLGFMRQNRGMIPFTLNP